MLFVERCDLVGEVWLVTTAVPQLYRKDLTSESQATHRD